MRPLLFAAMLLAQLSSTVQSQTGTISGRLLAADGTPAAGVRVSAMPAADPTNPSAPTRNDGTVLASLTQTDASGRYLLDNIPPGRYYVLAGFVDFPTYFPGVTATTTATAVSVAARTNVSNIDFQAARSAIGLNLRGRLKRDSNEGVAGLNIFLGGNDAVATPNVRSQADGSFEFSKLRPGTYTISVSTPNFAPQEIILTDGDISNLDFVIPWTVDVSGNVTVEGGGMRPNFTLTFAGGSRGISSTGARDAFRLTLPEGAYAVMANGLPSGFFIKSMKSGSTDLLSEPLNLFRGSPAPSIAVLLGVSTPPPWVKLAGHLTGLPNPHAAKVTITLNGSLGESPEAIIGADGSFEFPKLLPGNYSMSINPLPVALPMRPFVVPNTDVTDLRIALPGIKEISGRISVENGGPLPVTNLILSGNFVPPQDSGQPTLAQLLATASPPQTTMNLYLNLQQDGTFKAFLPEGRFQITVMPQFRNANGNAYVVKTFTYGVTDLIRNPISVSMTDTASMNLALGFASATASSKVTGRVSGVDSQFIGANPLTVTLSAAGLLTNWTSSVKPDGSFEFPKLYPGTYNARVTTANAYDVGLLNFGMATAAINVSGSDITGLEILVPSQKEITGRVRLEGRGAMPTFAFILTPPAGSSNPQPQYLPVNPQSNGSFKAALVEGERRVSLSGNLPPGYAIKSMMYGSTDVLKNPLKIAKTDTAELNVILTAPDLAPVRVSGKVTGLGTSFVRGAVTAIINGLGNTTTLSIPVNADRTFQFPEVFAGNYTVRVTGAGIASPPPLSFAVAGADITNLEIALPRQKEISGRVIVEGVAPMPRFQFGSPIAASSTGTNTQAQSMTIAPQADGTFKLNLLVGEHQGSTVTDLPAGFSVKSATYGTTDILKSGMKVAESDTEELRITLTTPGRAPVALRGHVIGVDDATFARGDVNVSLASASYVSPINTLVMKDGSFEFRDVFPGNYLARANGPGVRALSGVSVNVRNADVENVEIEVPSQKEMAGRVILEGSGPMPRITILLIPTSDTTAVGVFQNANIPPITGPTGGIITLPEPIPGPIPGPTLVAANGMTIVPPPNGILRLTIPAGEQRVGPISGLPPGYTLKELSYGPTDILKNPLKVAASDNFEFRAVVTTSNPKPVHVSGRVTGLDSAAFARGPVQAVLTSSMYAEPLNTPVHPDGTFEFTSVYPGTFALRASGIPVLNSPNVPVNVVGTDVGNIEIRVPSLKDITGRIVVEGGGPYPLFAVPLAGLPAPFNTPGASGMLPTIRPGTDGVFHIGLPPGEIRITNFVGLPPGYRVTAFAYGATDLLKNPLQIAESDTQEFQITVVNSATAVKVSGRIEGMDLTAAAKVPLRLTMISPSFMVPLTADVRPDGTFEFSRVFPGNYRIQAEADLSPAPRISIPLVVAEKEIADLVVTIPK